MEPIVVGIDIGGTNTEIGLVTQQGKCISSVNFSTQSHETFDLYLDHLTQQIDKLISANQQKYTIKGVGVGAPNGNYLDGTIVNAANLKWKGVLPLGQGIEDKLKVPVALTNDANAAALGEMLYGNAKGMKNFVVITLGTGLGSGIVVDGKLVLGADGFAGEFGHTLVKPFGRQCGCGKSGCLETYASAPGIRRTVFKLLSESNEPSVLRNYSYGDLSARQIAGFAEAGDPIAWEAFEYTGAILGMKLAELVAILSPEAILLTGGLSQAGSLIFEPTKRHMEKNLFANFKNKVKLLPSGLANENVGVIGASALIWQKV